jgi:hypothetical protein
LGRDFILLKDHGMPTSRFEYDIVKKYIYAKHLNIYKIKFSIVKFQNPYITREPSMKLFLIYVRWRKKFQTSIRKRLGNRKFTYRKRILDFKFSSGTLLTTQ